MLPISNIVPIDHAILLYIFIGSIGITWMYLLSRWMNLLASILTVHAEGTILEHSGTPKAGKVEEGKEPHVTIQICTYNEGAVAPETIAHACSMDWPGEKLHVQVLDDSTESDSISKIESAVSFWKAKGVDVRRCYRADRVGYKAGNLRHNFDNIVGEYVAYFDADHRAELDFLRNVIPYFYDEDGNSLAKVGLVQTPWGYYNTNQNLLTECGKSAECIVSGVYTI
jgi:cellulose synthase/poly-beta-1,6-N-acetylglucosamine synthase-like glycosyltransferase